MSEGLLTLCMILKDEAHSIARTLASVKPFVDRWVILDTGSTDGTQDIVRRELAGVPGELHEAPFVDFATTRNQSLELCGDATEYILWLDADDELVGGSTMRKALERDRAQRGADREAYYLQVDIGIVFDSARIVRSWGRFRFRGAVHEVLVHPNGTQPAPRLQGVTIKHEAGTESAERTRARWERDLVLLTRALETDPKDTRAAFYLAQTYFWLGRNEDAITAFQRRIALGGWHEEMFQAKLDLARASQRAGLPWQKVLELYLAAHTQSPHRAEPLHEIAFHYNGLAEHALCLLFARRGYELPPPKNDLLFIEHEVYRWKMADLVASAAYWVGEFQLGEEAARRAVRENPESLRLKANLAFYVDRKIAEKKASKGRR